MAGFTVTIEGFDGLDKALEEMAQRCVDQTPAWQAAEEILQASKDKTFEAEGRPTPWVPRAPSTLAQIEAGTKRSGWRQYDKILMRSGKLKDSCVTASDKRHVEIGTNKVYAAIHQFGGKAGRGHRVTIPARPFLVIQPEDANEITATIADYVAEPWGQP